MVFCKSGKTSKEKFYFNNVGIENSMTYKYLSIIFSASGTYKYCLEAFKRALRAQLELTNCFSNIAPRLDTLLHFSTLFTNRTNSNIWM